MKTKNLLFLLVLMCVAVSCDASGYANKTLQTIHERTSVREYTSQAVSEQTLMELVKAGMAAPSGSNKQPWEFVIVTDRATLDALGEVKPPVGKAQAAIIVAGNSAVSGSWMLDCSAATQNILLAVQSLGMGAVWTGVYGNAKFTPIVKELVNMPEDVQPLSVIAIGYPVEKQKAKVKFDQMKVHTNKF